MPPLRRVPLLALLCVLMLSLSIPAVAPREAGGRFDDLGVWVPDVPPAVTYLPGPDLGAYRNHSEMATYLEGLEAANPGLVERFSIGNTVRGLALWTVVVTDESVAGPKAKVLIDAAHHGDEIIGTEIALRLVRDLVAGYATDPTIRALLQGTEVWVVPMVNADGVTNIPTATHYAMARKNANSVDPNRNYGYKWGGAGSGGPGSDTYRGPNEFSEPETRAIRDLLQGHDFLTYISLHSGAELLLWPWGWTTTAHQETAPYDELGDVLTGLSGGVPNGQTSLILYTASGVSMDYAAGGPDKLRPFSFSPETYQGSGNAFDWYYLFNPPDADIEPVYQGWKPALLKMIETAAVYTAATLTMPDRAVNGESFTATGHLDVPGRRGFRNAVATVQAPAGLEVFSDATVTLGDVLQGQAREPSWIVQANANGTFQLVLRGLSQEAAGNLTRVVTIHAEDVVKYVRVEHPEMGAREANQVQLWLGGFGLTGVSGRLRLEGDGTVFVDETVAIPDGGSVQRALPFGSGDAPAGRRVLLMTYDLTGQGPEGAVTRHVEQRASYTILRPDLDLSLNLPGTGSVGTAKTLRATVRNTGNLATQDLRVTLDLPAGLVPSSGRTPTADDPLLALARPSPDFLAPTPDGKVRLAWDLPDLAPGAATTLDVRVVPVLPGTHAIDLGASYAMDPILREGGATLLMDATTGTLVVG